MQELSSWKNSFKRLSEENETAKKKRQALDNLVNVGKISQSTYNLFNTEIAEAIKDIERQQKELLQKMNTKIIELEEQTKTLEILLANFEIQHVAGEVNEEVYQREINVLSIGLETSRKELEAVKEAVDQLSNSVVTGEEFNDKTLAERLRKPKVEFEKVAETDTPEDAGEPRSRATSTEGEEKQKV